MDNDEQPAVMSHAESVSQSEEPMVNFKQQVEKTPAKLLMLKRLHDRVACKYYSKLMQQKLMNHFKKQTLLYMCLLC